MWFDIDGTTYKKTGINKTKRGFNSFCAVNEERQDEGIDLISTTSESERVDEQSENQTRSKVTSSLLWLGNLFPVYLGM